MGETSVEALIVRVATERAAPVLGDEVRVEIVAREALTAGTQSGHIERFRTRAWDTTSASCVGDFVYKRTWQAEVCALRALAQVPGANPALPSLLASGLDSSEELAASHPLRPAWIVTPHYEGRAVSRAALPDSVFTSLASVHGRYEGRCAALDGIVRVTAAWFRDDLCAGYVVPGIATVAARAPDPSLDRAVAWVTELARQPSVAAALGRLPRTLVHGDCHPGNILVSGRDATLLDWANARCGPATLDLANICELESRQVAAYRRRWEQVSERPIEPGLLELGYWYAKVQINTQYLVFVAETGGGGAVETMCREARRALAHLDALL